MTNIKNKQNATTIKCDQVTECSLPVINFSPPAPLMQTSLSLTFIQVYLHA